MICRVKIICAGKIYAECQFAVDDVGTGQPIDRIAWDVDRDYIMSAEQAVEYGMIDRVVSSRELTPHGHFAMMSVE